MKRAIIAILFAALSVVFSARPAVGQPPEVPPSISSARGTEFVSTDGLFRIQLPERGKEMVWTFSEGQIRMGFFDYLWAIKKIDASLFESLTYDFERQTLAKFPGRITDKDLLSNADPFHSVTHFSFADGSFGLQSHRMHGKRYYTILATFTTLFDRQKFETVLNSFQVTGEVDIEAVAQKKIHGLTLSPLPQSPVVDGENSDLVDEGLKGKVARIVEEVESLHSSRPSPESKPFLREIREYDKRGYLVKRIETGHHGLPYLVEVWGFVDGKRVLKRGFTIDRYSLFDPFIAPPLVEGPNVPDPSLGYDPRYFLSYKKTYKGGKLVEHLQLNNSGKVNRRRAFSFARNVMTTTVSGPTGDILSTTVVTLDNKGLPIKEADHNRPEYNSYPSTTVFSYKFDKIGNWTTKVVSLVQKDNGRPPVATPQYAIHRTITYY